MTSSSTPPSSPPSAVPRAAASVVVRYTPPVQHDRTNENDDPNIGSSNRYVLIQRGTEPSKGMWSLPGGKVESGERSIDAAQRELKEETGFEFAQHDGERSDDGAGDVGEWKMVWSKDGPISISDVFSTVADESTPGTVDDTPPYVAYHYVISQWFVELSHRRPMDDGTTPSPPEPVAGDDADGAGWWRLDEIVEGIARGEVTPGIERVIRRSEMLYDRGAL